MGGKCGGSLSRCTIGKLSEPMKYLRHHFGVQSNSNHAILHSLHSHSENVYVLHETGTFAAFIVVSVTRLWAEQPKNRGSIPGQGKIFLSPPLLPDRCSDPLSVLHSGHRLRSPGLPMVEGPKT